jgi:hypothetical protein
VTRLVLPDFPVQIVRREKRIVDRPREVRIDRKVSHAMTLVLIQKETMGEQCALVFDLLIGDDDQWSIRTWRTIATQLVQEFGTGTFQGTRLKSKVVIERIPSLLLIISHRT